MKLLQTGSKRVSSLLIGSYKRDIEISRIPRQCTTHIFIHFFSLSTIRNADRIALIDGGKVREIGSHDELMALPDGRYGHLQALQDLDGTATKGPAETANAAPTIQVYTSQAESVGDGDFMEVSSDDEKEHKHRAWLLGFEDRYCTYRGLTVPYNCVSREAEPVLSALCFVTTIAVIALGAVGALIAGLYFPAFGFVFGTQRV